MDSWVLELCWYNSCGYAATSTKPPVQMHRMIAREMGITGLVDHENRNKLDNRRSNLRPADMATNSANRTKAGIRAPSSPYKGVKRNGRSRRWCAQIKVKGQTRYLGSFATQEEAAAAYNRAAEEAFGAFAVLNQVPSHSS